MNRTAESITHELSSIKCHEICQACNAFGCVNQFEQTIPCEHDPWTACDCDDTCVCECHEWDRIVRQARTLIETLQKKLTGTYAA